MSPTSRLPYVALTLTVAGWFAVQTSAQTSSKVRSLPTMEEKRIERDRYFELRRTKPGDPEFDSALARQAAAQERRLQSSLRGRTPAATWENIGPAPTTDGQTPTSTPRIPSDVSGRLTAIAIDPVDGEVYVGGAQGGVWKSTDDGASWTPIFDDMDSIAIGSIALDPQDNDTIYVGTGEGNGSCDSYGGVGVYKSTDGGNTWTGPFGTAQFQNRGIPSIAVDRTNSDHLLATSASGIFGISCQLGPTLPSRGVYRSTDGGQTWSEVTSGNNRASVVLQDPVTATTWWAAMWFNGNGGSPDGGLAVSVDNGQTWSGVSDAVLPAGSSAWGRAWVTATTEDNVNSVIYVAGGQNGGSIWRSTDSGVNWTELVNARGYCSPQCFYDMPIYVEPGDPDVLYTGGAGASTSGSLPTQFMRSDNATAATPTFTDLVRSADNSTAVHADVHAFATWPGQPNKFWIATDGGVWRSDDRGTNLVDVNSNLAVTQFSGCDLHPTEDIAYGGTQDNGTMGWTGTEAWPHLDFGDGGFARIDQGDPDNLVHTYFNATNVLVGFGWTTNGFAATQGLYCGSFAPGNGMTISDPVLFYAPMHMDQGNTDTVYYGTNKLYRSTDFFAGANGTTCTGAGTFSALGSSQNLAPAGGALSAIETLANGSADASTLFTGSSLGEVFRSTNSGASFSQVDVGGSALFVSDIKVDPGDPNVIYQSRAGFSGAAGLNVRKSIDGGDTWFASGSGLPDIPVNTIEIDPVNAGWVWAGTDIGTYVSQDEGANWIPYNDGMATVTVFELAANATTQSLIACTHGRSVYRLDLAGDVGIFDDGFESGDTTAWSAAIP